MASNDLVLVTGASGFIALHIVQLLQKEGHRVRGTVRSLKNESKIKPIKSLCPGAKHPIELVEADLNCDDGWDDAVKGCTYVMHVASPFPNTVPKDENDLIRPAVDGTLRVLKACTRTSTVKRVVLTSSISAVHGETASVEGRVYTEDDWTDVTDKGLEPYPKSKTLAEKAAWDYMRSLKDSAMELVVINPGLVMGPIISGIVCTSVELIKRMMDGSMPLIPRMHLCICDVKDVARAHVNALTAPDAANRRHLVVSGHLWLQDIAHILREAFAPQGYFIPTWPAPNFLLWFYSFVDSSTGLILNRIGRTYTFSNRRMKEVLGVTPREVRDTLVDTVDGLVESGAVKKTKKFRSGGQRKK